MNAILGYSELIQEEAGCLDQKGFIPGLQKIHGAGKHLLGLINHILDLSKVEAGKMTLFLEDVDVAKLVEEVASTVRPLVARNGNRLEAHCPADIPVVMLTITDNKNMGFALGAADYFTKPIDWQRLAAVLHKYRKPADTQSVLVVEDDERTREMLRRAMQKEGWQIREAANDRLGLEHLSHGAPGLILLDLMMPEMDGFEVLSRIKKDPALSDIPVFVVTAKDLTDAEIQLLKREARALVRKNGSWKVDLLAQVRKVVGNSKLAKSAGQS